MARARGDLDRQNQAGVEAERRPSTAATLDALRSVAGRTTGPPTWMAPVASRLVEEIAHGEDIDGIDGGPVNFPVTLGVLRAAADADGLPSPQQARTCGQALGRVLAQLGR